MFNNNAKVIGLLTATLVFNGCWSNPSTTSDIDQLTDETSCYKDASKTCYKKVIKRGRTFEAVYQAGSFKPFRRLSDSGRFDPGTSPEVRFQQMWDSNPGWVMASLSHAAYLTDREELKALLSYIGAEADDNYIFDVNNHQGYLAVFPDKAILVFRGTEPDEFPDLLVDANILTDKFEGIRVHQGFYKATIEVWHGAGIEQKLNSVSKNLTDSSNIYVTGHSLGAALAVDSGFLYEFREIVTFGQPRVAKDDLRPLLKGNPRYLRYINGNDKVTDVPPEELGWQHSGTANNIKDQDGPFTGVLPYPINLDHSPLNYAYILFSQTPSFN